MNRREFLEVSSKSSILLSSLPIIDLSLSKTNPYILNPINPSNVDKQVRDEFILLLRWLSNNGWINYLRQRLNLNIDIDLENDLNILQEKIPNISSIRKIKGIEDFAGDKLIEPGIPSLSLLYHILASPRVKTDDFQSYASLLQIDQLENYIYSLAEDIKLSQEQDSVFRMVLAYEYRPAYKTPPFYPTRKEGKKFAQLVYSRCGISRIGNRDMNYDQENRCYTNLPVNEGEEQKIAVTPARYGLFWVKLVESRSKSISVMDKEEKDDKFPRYFICPIRKIFDTQKIRIKFGEYHIIEKLKKLNEYSYNEIKIKFDNIYDFDKPPFTRISATTDDGSIIPDKHRTNKNFVKLERIGSSVLLISIPDDLIQEVVINEKIVSIKVPPKFKKLSGHRNRRYSALKLPNEHGHETTNVIISDGLLRKKRRTTGLRSPKIAPLFVNIKYEVETGKVNHIDGLTEINTFEDKIKAGGYWAQVFQDNICDGCISAKIYQQNNSDPEISIKAKQVVPAFSIVTAPDFFPLIDSHDIRAYYFNDPETNTDQHFYEGGTINLSQIRLKGNPAIMDPFSSGLSNPAFEQKLEKGYDTLTAVVSVNHKNEVEEKDERPFKLNFQRDYHTTSHLPDTGTGVFFPGWDITYSGDKKNKFFATYGLGLPFPEDMKLCAAANGMWPVTSPDAGRTFQGSMEPLFGKIPNTSIPLMDAEIGRNINCPFVKDFGGIANYGWDGEQGPYLEVKDESIFINYTDIERADYVQNLRNPDIGFDMSLLRKLKTSEIINRMDCLRKVIRVIDKKKVWKTKLWLVNAEKVGDWNLRQDLKCLPQKSFFEKIRFNEKQNIDLKGVGYFFVFVLASLDGSRQNINWDDNDKFKKRRRSICEKIWLCQITCDAISFLSIDAKTENIDPWQSENFNLIR